MSEHSRQAPSPSQKKQISAHDQRIAAGIGLLLTAIYLGTGAFHFFAIDEIATFALTRSMLSHGATNIDILAWVPPLMNEFSVSAPGLDGHTYAIKDIAPSVLMLPFASLGYLFHISPVRLVYLLPVLVTALTASLLYLVIRYLGYRQRSAILGSLVYGLASMAFPYAKVIFTQPVAAFGLLIGLWGILRARDSQKSGWAVLGGIGLGISGLSAAPTWVTAPIYLACLVFEGTPDGSWRLVKSRSALRLILVWGATLGIFLISQGTYNQFRFGSPFETGHRVIGTTMDLSYIGLTSWAQIISTPRGVIWFAPFVILIPFSIPAGIRQKKLGLQLACLLMGALVLLVYGTYFNWSAGVSFGPRYLTMVMPGLVLTIMPLLDSFLDQMKLWRRLLVGVILFISALTELGGSLLDYSRAETNIYKVLADFTPPQSFFAYSPEMLSPANLIQVHLFTALRRGWWDVLWMSREAPDWPLLAGIVVLVIVGLISLVIVARGVSLRLARALQISQVILTIGFIGWAFGSYPRTAGYSRIESAPDPDLDRTLIQLSQSASPGDGVVVTFFLDGNLAWLENPIQSPPDIGLPLEAQLRPTTVQSLEHISDWYDRVWVASHNTVPGDPQNGIEAWLSSRAFVGTSLDTANYRLVPYSFSPEPMLLQPASHSFGDQAIMLIGFASELDAPGGNDRLYVWLRWEAQREISQNETVFVHLIDSKGSLVAQHDGIPQAGYSPTLIWRSGTVIDDRHSLQLPAHLPDGDYTLIVGFYDADSREPLPVDGSSAASAVLMQIHIGSEAR